MKLKEFETLMAPIIEYSKEIDAFNDNLKRLLPEVCAFTTMGYDLLDSYIDLVSEKCNDADTWISYYVYECELGTKPMEVIINNDFGKKKFKLSNLKTLLKLIKYKES